MSRYMMGQGKVYVAQRGVNGKPEGFRMLGNCTALDVALGRGAVRYAAPGLFNHGGGAPRFTLNLESFEKENIALALNGEVDTIPADAEVVVSVVGWRGLMTPLPHIDLIDVTMVGDASNNPYPATAYTVNLRAGSIEIPADSPIPDGATLIVHYLHKAHTSVGAYTQKAKSLALRFEGVNTLEDNSPVVLDIFHVKIDPVDDMSFISDNFSSLKLQGKVFPDDSLLGSRTEGRFLRIRQAI